MNESKLRVIALTAEIVGGIAVVVTLVFLVLETTKNTSALQAQTYQSLISELNEYRRFTSSLDNTEIRLNFVEGGRESLSSIEGARYMEITSSLWGIYESAYYALERGVLGNEEWSRFVFQICRRRNGIDASLWSPESGPALSRQITTGFRDYVDSACL